MIRKIQNTRKSLPCRIAVATKAGLLAVVAGVGMTPAGAEDVSVKAEAGVEAEASPEKVTNFIIKTDGPAPAAFFDLEADIDNKGGELSAEVGAGVAPNSPDKAAEDLSVEAEAEAGGEVVVPDITDSPIQL